MQKILTKNTKQDYKAIPFLAMIYYVTEGCLSFQSSVPFCHLVHVYGSFEPSLAYWNIRNTRENSKGHV